MMVSKVFLAIIVKLHGLLIIKTYEDITTVVPLKNSEDDEDVQSVVTVSMPIEDLRTFSSSCFWLYSKNIAYLLWLEKVKAFVQMKERAYRVARNKKSYFITR